LLSVEGVIYFRQIDIKMFGCPLIDGKTTAGFLQRKNLDQFITFICPVPREEVELN
jgi:hypothetical protein